MNKAIEIPAAIKSSTFVKVLFVILFTTSLSAQETESQTNLVTVKSSPLGAVVVLEGDYQFIGRTPFVLPYDVTGNYEIKVSKLGYNTVRKMVTFSGDSPTMVYVNLKPKTRIKAAARSLIVPGWGQYYSNRRTLGTLIGFAASISLTSYVYSQFEYVNTSRDYDRLTAKALTAPSYDERLHYAVEADDLWKDLEHKTDMRDLNLVILSSIWALNILDSIFFFPNYGKEVEFFEKLSLNVTPKREGFALGLQFSLD